MKLRKIAFRNILRNTRRSVLSGLAIAISAMIITIMMSLYAGIGKDMRHNVYSYFTGHIRIRNNKYNENEDLIPLQFGIDKYKNIMSGIEKIDSVKALTPRIQFGTVFYGSPRLYINDITDWEKFLNLLKTGGDPVFSFMKEKYLYARERLAERGINIPDLNAIDSGTDNMQKGDLLFGLNEALERYVLYNKDRAAGISLSEETRQYTEKNIRFEERILFNRLLLEDAYPDIILKNPRDGKMIPGVGMGLDFEKDIDFINLGERITKGNLPAAGTGTREMVLTSGLAEKLNATVGDRITISTKTKYQGINAITLTVSGIAELPIAMFNSRGFYLPIETAQNVLKMNGSVSEILVLLKNENKIKSTVPLINSIISDAGLENVQARPWSTIDIYPAYLMLIDIVGYYMGLFFFLLGSTVIITTTMMVIYERMREIGTMAALGMKGSQIVKLFFLESFFIGAIASFIGVVIGSGIAIAMNVFKLMDWTKQLEGIDMAISGLMKPAWNIQTALIIFLYSTTIASVASFLPSRRAAKIQPVEALRAV